MSTEMQHYSIQNQAAVNASRGRLSAFKGQIANAVTGGLRTSSLPKLPSLAYGYLKPCQQNPRAGIRVSLFRLLASRSL